MSRAGGLGRGLASLIPDSALDGGVLEEEPPSFRLVPIDEIRANPEQPRTSFNREALEALAESLRNHGVLSPLVVRRYEGQYVLIAGERRLRAAGLAGLTEVPVLVRESHDGSEQLELALVENLQREDLDPIESALGFQRLMEEYGYTQEQVAVRVGKKRATVANAIRLLRLPMNIQLAIRQGRISAGHGRAMLPISEERKLERLLVRIIAQQLSVRATEAFVARMVHEKSARSSKGRKNEGQMDYANELLSEVLHTSVSIRPRQKGGGRIVIEYADTEDLERLIHFVRSKG
jgi:ParB family transcriptional regulator, chromosome partitioning protein